MGRVIGRVIAGFFISLFLFFGISSCNLFGESKGGYDCGEGGCPSNPEDFEFENVVP